MTWALWHPAGGAIGHIVDAHCRDNRRRNRPDRKYLLVEASPAREQARKRMRAALENTLGLQPLHFFWHLLTHMEDAVFVFDDVHGNPHLIPPLDTSAAGSNAC
jgi:hypothetical protein